MKKTISLFLALLMALSLMVISAGAEGYTPFTDIGGLDDYTQSNIEYLYVMEIMKGTSDTTFSPDALYTRAMFVTMLGRTEGIDPSDYPGTNFKDVSAGNWAAPYINWAAQNGIVNGVGDGKFNPNGIITMEQYCTIICRYMDAKALSFNCDSTGSWPPHVYDLDDASSYAKQYVQYMVENNMTDFYRLDESDTAGVYVEPKHEMDRAEIAFCYGDFYYILESGDSVDWDFGYAQVSTSMSFG